LVDVLLSETPKMSGGATVRTNEQNKKPILNVILIIQIKKINKYDGNILDL